MQKKTCNDSKTSLLGNIIDYAGTFPPASLSLEDTLKKASSFRRESHFPWLTGKMALNTKDILSLTQDSFYNAGWDGSVATITALGTALTDNNPENWIRTLDWDLRQLLRWQEKGWGSSVRRLIVGYETKLPDIPTASLDSEVGEALETLSNDYHGAIDAFIEIPWDLFATHARKTAQAIVEWKERKNHRWFFPGLKFRTGGTTKPDSEKLAQAIEITTAFGLKFKATQGLHEAVTNSAGFGFVNLFAAINLVQSLGSEKITQSILEEVLNQTSAEAFEFKKDSIVIKTKKENFELSKEALESARKFHGATFGSCSIDEPEQSLIHTFGG